MGIAEKLGGLPDPDSECKDFEEKFFTFAFEALFGVFILTTWDLLTEEEEWGIKEEGGEEEEGVDGLEWMLVDILGVFWWRGVRERGREEEVFDEE